MERDVNLLFVSRRFAFICREESDTGTAAVYAMKKAMKIATDNPIDNLFFW